jgi:hypothetical protein
MSHADVGSTVSAYAAAKGSDCFNATICCSQCLKTTFPNRTHPVFKLFVDGHFFVRVTAPSDGSASSSSDAAPASLAAEHMWHIGMMYLSPYRPTFQSVEIVGTEGEVDGDPIRVRVKATAFFLTEMRALKQLDKDRTWRLGFYQMDDGPRPLGTFVPNVVSATRYSITRQLWPKLRRLVFRAPRGAGKPAPEPNHPEVDTAAGDGGNSDDEIDEAVVAVEGDGDCGPTDDAMDELDALVERMFDEMAAADANADPNDQPVPEPAPDDGPAPAVAPPLSDPLEDPPLPPPLLDPPDDSQPPIDDAPPQRPRLGRERALPEAMVYVTGGCIKWYRSKNVFEAHCDNPRHVGCVLSRTSTDGRRRQQGRCLGFLVRWLRSGSEGDCNSKAAHWSAERLNPSRELRIESRTTLKAMHTGAHMLAFERPKRLGEDSEPELCA